MLDPQVSTSSSLCSHFTGGKTEAQGDCPRTPGSPRAVAWTLVGSVPVYTATPCPVFSPSLPCALMQGAEPATFTNPHPTAAEASTWLVSMTLLPARPTGPIESVGSGDTKDLFLKLSPGREPDTD